MMTKNTFKSTLAALGVGLAFASAPATAAITFFSPITTFEDDNLDFVVDTNNSGTIDVGDRLIAVLRFNVTTGVLPGQGPNPIAPLELTAISDITAVGVGLDGRLIFAPSGAAGVLSAFAPNTTAVLWTDTSPDTNVINSACGTRAQCLASAGLGGDPGSSLYASIGFTGDPDELWISGPNAAGQSIAPIQGGGATVPFQTFNYSQGFIINNTGQTFGELACAPFCAPGGDGLVEIIGGGQLLGGQFLNPAQWTARSDNDTQVAPIPEPGTLALFAMGLLGFGFGLRKRNS
jgi:hypothetical protein